MSAARRGALIALAALCVAVAAGYVALAALSSGDGPSATAAAGASGQPVALSGSQLMARAVDRGDRGGAGEVFVLRDGRRRSLSGPRLECRRVYFAGGRGLCLRSDPSLLSYEATIFDRSLRTLATLPLAGLPSRARVSADGRYGAITVFVNGHEYLGAGGFSTATTIVDMREGRTLGNLESFAVGRAGSRLEAADFNFWGVTFSPDPDRFYATLHSGDHYYLVEGSVGDRAVTVLRDGVECPSLSPDGTRIAFKSRIGDEDRWRLAVLDLTTLAAHPVAEQRSIDDQPAWLGDDTLVYSDGLDVYTVPADGGGSARLVLDDASSPVPLESG